MAKLAIIGLDGATWDLLRPWADGGKLPGLAKLMGQGVWGELESTVPPVTSPAWVSLATGMNPARIGVFDFLSRRDKGYKLHPTSSGDFHGKAIWDYVTFDRSKRAMVLNYPMLFPPYGLNGCIVCNTTLLRIGDVTFPRSLKAKLDEVCGGYENFVPYHDRKYDDTELFLKDLHRVLEKQTMAVYYLMKEPWDLLVYVLSATDWAQHLMWKYIDSSHPLYKPEESQKYGAGLLNFWQKIDHSLEEIAEANEEANIFIVSDHGFGPQDECFNLAKWLQDKGYLVKKGSKTEGTYLTIKNSTAAVLRLLAKTRLRMVVPDKFVQGVWSRLKVDITSQINFAESRAYVLGHTIPFGAIYINKEGRDLQGWVKNEEYETLRAEIVNGLRNLKEDTGKDVEVEIFDPNEIYKGSYIDRAPDIIFTIDNWRCIVNEGRFDDALFKNEPYSNRHTGSHRMNGVFLAHGPDIKSSGEKLSGLKIYDIAPTVLHMFGIPIPGNVDGRVLKEIFKEGSQLAQRPTAYRVSDEEEKIKAKIRKLTVLKRI